MAEPFVLSEASLVTEEVEMTVAEMTEVETTEDEATEAETDELEAAEAETTEAEITEAQMSEDETSGPKEIEDESTEDEFTEDETTESEASEAESSEEETTKVAAKNPKQKTPKLRCCCCCRRRRRRHRRRRRRADGFASFATYFPRVLNRVHTGLSLSQEAVNVLDSFVKDMFERIAEEAARLAHSNKRSTITSREIQTSVRLLLPGELRKHAMSVATKAVIRYTTRK